MISSASLLGTERHPAVYQAMIGICIVGVAAMVKDSRSDSDGWQAMLGVAITLAGVTL